MATPTRLVHETAGVLRLSALNPGASGALANRNDSTGTFHPRRPALLCREVMAWPPGSLPRFSFPPSEAMIVPRWLASPLLLVRSRSLGRHRFFARSAGRRFCSLNFHRSFSALMTTRASPVLSPPPFCRSHAFSISSASASSGGSVIWPGRV